MPAFSLSSVSRILGVVLLGASLWLCSSATVSAQSTKDKDLAAELFARAEKAYQSGDYASAIDWLENAFKLDPDPVIHYNLARAYEGAKAYDRALGIVMTLIEREGLPAQLQLRLAEDKLRLEEFIAKQTRQGTLQVKSAPSRARVFINGVKQEEVTPTRLVLAEGEHTLLLQLDGYQSHEQVFVLEHNSEVEIDIFLPPLIESDAGPSSLSVAAYITLGVGVVGLGTGLATYFSAKSRYDAFIDSGKTDQDARDAGRTWSTISVVSYVVGGSALTIGGGLLLWSLLAADEDDGEASAGWVPRLCGPDLAHGGMNCAWRW